jgi:hypothetical protein
VYHLIIWRERVSSGVGEYHLEGACIIWKGRVSSGAGEYYLKKGGVYHLAGRVSTGAGLSSAGVCIIWWGRVSSGAEEYHREGSVSSLGGGYHLEQ